MSLVQVSVSTFPSSHVSFTREVSITKFPSKSEASVTNPMMGGHTPLRGSKMLTMFLQKDKRTFALVQPIWWMVIP
ncbi:hypothetical protein L3X38_034595 [Prunus dulcis]|uniref:Uncharacterized protein n=1 Tax=Prunus dulcis TaxID=3755 RepID=A0AAD4YXW4_PRUDU|nr:hypothetical protein L3X38_034595 [Prunus dulcis]